MLKRMVIMACCLLILNGCAAPQKAAEYKRITAEEAKQVLDTKQGAIILDVRTQEEYDQGHIPNALLIPNTDISKQADTMLPDKNATILVYCRSGNRSKSASEELLAMGYTKVYDFGGINNWPYDITEAQK